MTNLSSAEERRRRRYTQILQGAIRAFSRTGFANTKMSDIAGEAGIADGTLYLYVESKKDLLIKAFGYAMGKIIERVDRELAPLTDPIERLTKMMEIHFDVLEQDPELAGFLQFQLRQPDPAIRATIKEPLRVYAGRFEAVIEDGKKAGVFRKSIGTRPMRRVFFGAMDETVSAWWFRDGIDPLLPKAKELMETILHGFLEK